MKRIDWPIHSLIPGKLVLHAEALSKKGSDAMEIEVPVKAHGMEQRLVRTGRVADAWHATLVLPEGSSPGTSSIELTVTAGPTEAILQALPYLAGYPYGCVEQTMSRFLPAVVASSALRRVDNRLEKLEGELPKMVDMGLQKLYGFQHDDGGWGWWKHDDTHPFMTAYVIYGLVSAQEAGIAIDGRTLKQGVNALANMKPTPFGLYALSRAGRDVSEQLAVLKPGTMEERAWLVLAGRKDLAAGLKAKMVKKPWSEDRGRSGCSRAPSPR